MRWPRDRRKAWAYAFAACLITVMIVDLLVFVVGGSSSTKQPLWIVVLRLFAAASGIAAASLIALATEKVRDAWQRLHRIRRAHALYQRDQLDREEFEGTIAEAVEGES